MLRPLRQITDTAERITGEGLHERLALDGTADELTELADTFDTMPARLEASFTDQQLFAANAAHQVRTPLAVMRAELDLLLTGPQPSPDEVHDTVTTLRRTEWVWSEASGAVVGCLPFVGVLTDTWR